MRALALMTAPVVVAIALACSGGQSVNEPHGECVKSGSYTFTVMGAEGPLDACACPSGPRTITATWEEDGGATVNGASCPYLMIPDCTVTIGCCTYTDGGKSLSKVPCTQLPAGTIEAVTVFGVFANGGQHHEAQVATRNVAPGCDCDFFSP